MTTNMNTASELYLGSDRKTALALGPRRFRTASSALRFAMEQAAPVSRRGALLQIGERRLDPEAIARAYDALPPSRPVSRPNGYLLDSSEALSP